MYLSSIIFSSVKSALTVKIGVIYQIRATVYTQRKLLIEKVELLVHSFLGQLAVSSFS